jgi:hypothetical protein
MDSPTSQSDSFPSSPKSKGLFGRLSRACAANASVCLALIIVLITIIIVMYVYYHGLFGLGPFITAKTQKKNGRKKKSGFTNDEDAEGSLAPDDKADAETEKLIDTINSQ